MLCALTEKARIAGPFLVDRILGAGLTLRPIIVQVFDNIAGSKASENAAEDSSTVRQRPAGEQRARDGSLQQRQINQPHAAGLCTQRGGKPLSDQQPTLGGRSPRQVTVSPGDTPARSFALVL